MYKFLREANSLELSSDINERMALHWVNSEWEHEQGVWLHYEWLPTSNSDGDRKKMANNRSILEVSRENPQEGGIH